MRTLIEAKVAPASPDWQKIFSNLANTAPG